MYLKRLEMENFKSFKGEVIVPYERGFTAITGPNGSGKSNCGDAIQFVLGYKSAKDVRANNVLDLLFNGGKNNKPAKFCKVSLIFDNPEDSDGTRRLKIDADEVHFTRTVKKTRSGAAASNYYLNGEPSSQRQFKLLLSSANARADGYNIVLQGMVTELATMTGKSRRKVLEEVAGVTSYDDEIRKAEKQRKRVEEYLERIELLEDELKIRLKDLKSERTQALKYKELKYELDNARILLHQSKFCSAQAEIDYITQEQINCINESKNASEKAQEGEKQLMRIEEKVISIEKQMRELLGDESSSLMDRLNQLRLDIDRRSDKISEAEQIIEENIEKLEYYTEDADDASNNLNEHLKKQKDAKSALQDAKNTFEKAEKDENEAKNALMAGDKETNSLTRELGKANQRVSDSTAALTKVQLEYDRIDQSYELSATHLASLEEEEEEARLSRDDLLMQGEELKSEDSGDDRETLANELTQKQREEQKLREENDIINSKLISVERDLVKARAEMENKSGIRGGMAMAVSTILNLRDEGKISGVLGTLSQLAKPKESFHESALVTAIGAGMQSIIVENDDVAAKCITILRENKAGRATFLPLNKLQVRRPSGKALMLTKEDNVEGFAWELLDYDPRIELAIKYVLKDTLLVSNLSTARKHMGGVRMVTLKGDLTEPGGAMVGGNQRRNRVMFGGQIAGSGEVERLEGELKRLQLLGDTVLSALTESRKQQQIVHQKISSLTTSDGMAQIKQWNIELKAAEDKLSKIIIKIKNSKNELNLISAEKIRIEKKLESAKEECEKAEEQRLNANLELQKASPEHLQKTLRDVQQLRVNAQAIQAKAEAQLAGGEEHSKILNDRLDELINKIKSIKNESINKKTEISSWKKEQSLLKSELKELEEKYSTITEENRELEDSRVKLVEERGSLRTTVNQLIQQAESARRRSSEHTMTLENKRNQLNSLIEEMELAGVSKPENGASIPTVAQAENKIKGIEKRLEFIGNVNMLSIEQYDKTEIRLDELKNDNKLCQSRRKSLIDITEKLEKQRKKRLLAVFKEVNKNFKTVYRLLSDGGRGELKLENSENPFKGGLEMWCQPRGKSSRSRLNGLSGGEKSMAALSLIFAIQDHDPSPFYYFDEVDQNLDAFNAERIARLCKARANSAQFLMVTLRKVSLQLADHHIGITHAGDGCSRRIADFNRQRAIELGEKAEENREKAAKELKSKQEKLSHLPSDEDMPVVPEPMAAPNSLGGLDLEIKGEVKLNHDKPLSALSERAGEVKEDIEELQELKDAIKKAEKEDNEDITIQIPKNSEHI
ncbi:MAG: chromosome segregation protein SMC [Methanobacteriota archaeon]|nr:MAG: chromosome segregation protein SMC [Euryarchaeota archaeon]|tara:strand:+ start:19284 stop:23195 length:3912 start_codon:yes stop_codon:yes gene_type:complete